MTTSDPRVRRCAASIPHANDEDGWRYCELDFHTYGTPHKDADGGQWQDGDAVEVTIVEEIFAVEDHRHDFVGDENTCVRLNACQMTWGEYRAQERERE